MTTRIAEQVSMYYVREKIITVNSIKSHVHRFISNTIQVFFVGLWCMHTFFNVYTKPQHNMFFSPLDIVLRNQYAEMILSAKIL